VRYILKSYFDDFVEGLDRNIDCSELPVNIRNLKIKHHRIKEEMEDSAFEFTDGTIGRVQLQMSWRGHLEVLADNIVLNFSFYPMKAMKKALLPEAWRKEEDEEDEKEDKEDDAENQVPLDIQRRLAAHPPAQQGPRGSPPQQPPPMPVPPRFCVAHGTSEKRPKAEPRTFECETCRVQLQTNYAEAKLCPPCSEKNGRCMCCGAPAPAPAPGAIPPVDPASGQPGAAAREATPVQGPLGGPAMLQQQPVFCARHGKSEFRPKVEPQERECRSCQAKLQTNYADFAVCPGCSRRDGRCMICGAPADAELPASTPPAAPPPVQVVAAMAEAVDEEELEHERCLPPPPPPLDLSAAPVQPQMPQPPPRRPPPGPGPRGSRASASQGAPRRADTEGAGQPMLPPQGMRQLSMEPQWRPDRPQRNSWPVPGAVPPPEGVPPQWVPRRGRMPLEPDRW